MISILAVPLIVISVVICAILDTLLNAMGNTMARCAVSRLAEWGAWQRKNLLRIKVNQYKIYENEL